MPKKKSDVYCLFRWVFFFSLLILLIITNRIEADGAQQGVGGILGNLKAHVKLHAPDRILSDFVNGKNETAVIVHLQPSTAANALSSHARLSGQVPHEFTGRGAPAYYHLKDESVKRQLKTMVTEDVDRVIQRLGARGIKVTQRFSYQFGFAALVTPEALERIADLPDAIAIQQDSILEAHLAQGIPLMNAAGARSSYGGSGVSIAICDTGIDTSHPRLGGGGFPNAKVIGGYDTGDNDADPRPNSTSGQSHGTACAGIAAGSTGTVVDYIGGVAPDAKLYAVKISYGNTGSAYESAMIAGWEWAVTHKNDDPNNPILIISTSFGGGRYFSTCDSESPAMTTAAANAVAAGITIFASSGNDGYCDSMGWPACISYVNSVGAVYDANFGRYPAVGYVGCIDAASCAGYTSGCPCSTGRCYVDSTTVADKVTSYSNSASFLTLFAPSNQAYTTDIVGAGGYASGDYYSSFGGTSAACPYAAGAAAVLQHAAKARTGSFLTPTQIKSSLVSNGDPVTDGKAAVTKPRINLGNAVNALALPDTTPNPFTFTDQTNVALNTVITSNTITVSGINATAIISITGGTYSINGSAYTSDGGTVSNGNTVTVRVTSSGSYSTTTNATLTIGGISDTFSVTTLAAPCIYTLDPTGQSFTAWKGSGSVGVTVLNGCPWGAASNTYWIAITSGGGGSGNGTVNYSVAANNGTTSRSGTMTIAGQTFTVTQDSPIPITCIGSPARIARTAVSYPTLQQAYDAALNNDTIQVQAVEFIGNLTVNRNIAATLSGGYACDFGTDTGLYTALRGMVQTLAGGGALIIRNMNIKPPCAFTVSPVTAIVTSSSGGYSATVAADSGCGWTAVSNAAWMTITSGSPGTGNGTVNYTVTANPSKDPRTGTLTIAGQTLTVVQDGAPCSYSLTSAGQAFGNWGGTGSVGVTAIGGCTWSGQSDAAWITITSGGNGVGSGTVNYGVAANSGAGSRSGTMTIGGSTFTVTQAAGPLSCVGSPVRNLNTGVTYASLQSAYDAALDGHTLQAQGVPITGNLTVNRNITVTVEGGYGCDFGTYGGINTPLTGSIRTMPGGGTLIIKNFQLK